MYYTYLLRCSDDTLYCGITTDLARRVDEHNRPDSKTKYTRSRQPVALVYSKAYPSRSAASRAEVMIKSMSRSAKQKLIDLNSIQA